MTPEDEIISWQAFGIWENRDVQSPILWFWKQVVSDDHSHKKLTVINRYCTRVLLILSSNSQRDRKQARDVELFFQIITVTWSRREKQPTVEIRGAASAPTDCCCCCFQQLTINSVNTSFLLRLYLHLRCQEELQRSGGRENEKAGKWRLGFLNLRRDTWACTYWGSAGGSGGREGRLLLMRSRQGNSRTAEEVVNLAEKIWRHRDKRRGSSTPPRANTITVWPGSRPPRLANIQPE